MLVSELVLVSFSKSVILIEIVPSTILADPMAIAGLKMIKRCAIVNFGGLENDAINVIEKVFRFLISSHTQRKEEKCPRVLIVFASGVTLLF